MLRSLELLAATTKFPTYFVAVYVVGFIAAVTIGSIAWYSSRKPPGWENAERPSIIPKINTEKDSK